MSGSGRFDPENDPMFETLGICHTCVHQRRNPINCDAFPDGIPIVILTGDFLHTTSYVGDHGIMYESKVV